MHNVTLLRAELRDRRRQIDNVTFCTAARIDRGNSTRLSLRAQGQPTLALIDADHIDALSTGNAVDPRRKLRGVRQVLQSANRANPRLLDNVTSKFWTTHRACGVSHQLWGPATRQPIESVPRTALDQHDQVPIQHAIRFVVHRLNCLVCY